mgnify:FL=1
MIPGLLYYLIFHYLPMIGVVIAFKDYNPYQGLSGIFTAPWVGLKYFSQFIKSVNFWRLIRNTFMISFAGLIFGFPAPIILAVLINEIVHKRFKKLVQTISYLPHFLSTVIVCGIIRNILSTDGGFVNLIIKALEGEPIYFLGESRYFVAIMTISGIWQHVGWNSIIYLAAITNINPELYESAHVDGANTFQKMWHITIPGIFPIISIMLILRVGELLTVGYEKVLLQSTGEKIFFIMNYAFMVIFMIIIIIPLLTVVATSFVSEAEILRRGVFILIPEKFDLGAYKLLWGSMANIIRAYKNTIFRVVVGTAVNLFVTITLAFGLSRKDLKGRKVITALIFFTMIFSGGMIPTYLTVKYVGLLNTRWAMILPMACNTWNMLIMRNFFYQIPKELEEAAYIDGAKTPTVLLKIFIPLSIPSIATIGLFYAVAHWNAWFDAVLYITDKKLLPMQNILRNIVASANSFDDLDSQTLTDLEAAPPAQSTKSATIIISTLPILIVYPFIQKYFVKGVMVGSVKG